MISFVLVNEGTVEDEAFGGPLTPEILQTIADACLAQLNGEFSKAWGGGYAVRIDTRGNVREGECPVIIQDKLDVPAAAGYHDLDTSGAPAAYIARTCASSLTKGSGSLSVTISHELLEAAGDPCANRWVDRGDGTEEAIEVADRVEDVAYEAPNGVAVSDFLLPSAFDPLAERPFSFRDSIAHPFDMTPGGYALVRSVGTDEHQATPGHARLVGNPPARRASKAHHPSSRVYRRGVRMASHE